MERREQLRINHLLIKIEQETESLLRIPMLDQVTVDYLNQKRELVQKARRYLMALGTSEINDSKETRVVVLSENLPLAYRSLVYQFVDYQRKIQAKIQNGDCCERHQQTLKEIESLIDFLLIEIKKIQKKKLLN